MRRIAPLLFAIHLLLLCGCTSIDCPLNSTVYCKYVVAGEVSPLPDTLFVTAISEHQEDVTLLNREVDVSDFLIPISYTQPVDVLVFSRKDSLSAVVNDTVRLSKLDQPHFESIDCTPSYFHTLTSVEWTTHAIDSIIITKSKVTYDTTGGNIHIYFKSRD